MEKIQFESKDAYEGIEIEIIEFDKEDVIQTSNGNGEQGGEQGNS